MISCESAAHTTNLYYSALKFLSFKKFVWSGQFLPLKLHSIGELFSSQVTLRTEDGKKVEAFWERGLLHANFEPGKLYNLDLRLEYCLPVTTETFSADFLGIHPKSYLVALDFSQGNLPDGDGQIKLALGPDTHRFSVTEPFERFLQGGQQVGLHQQGDYFSFVIKHDAGAPFAHRHFPELSLLPAEASVPVF